jgi:hypothetical protein
MHPVRLRSVLVVLCFAAMLTVGCGQGNSAFLPTAPTGALGSAALGADEASDMTAAASSVAGLVTLDRGRDGKGKAPEVPGQAPGAPKRDNRGELSGFVTAISVDSLTVGASVVMVDLTTVIRHGNRILTMSDIRVGDHVQARGTVEGTTLTATEIKVEGTGRGDDDDDDDDGTDAGAAMPLKGVVSGLTGTCPTLTFTVGTTQVTTTSTTVFDDVTCATLANGATVEIAGAVQVNLSIVATTVEGEAGPDEVIGTASALSGTCPALTFTVGTTVVTTTGTTSFTGVTCAAIANGVAVEVEGIRQLDGSIVSASVELE